MRFFKELPIITEATLTLIKVACQPVAKEGLVVFKTPTSRGRWGGARLFTTKTLESSVKVKF